MPYKLKNGVYAVKCRHPHCTFNVRFEIDQTIMGITEQDVDTEARRLARDMALTKHDAIHGTKHSLKNPVALERHVLQKALANARSKAALLAEQSRLTLGSTTLIEEDVSSLHPVHDAPLLARQLAGEDVMLKGPSAQRMAPGRFIVKKQVKVIYELQQPQ